MRKGFKQTAKLFSSIIILVLCGQQTTAQYQGADYGSTAIPLNFVRTWDATAPIQDGNILMTKPLTDVKQTTQYLDGLGRPLQTVMKKGSFATDPLNPLSSANATDMVSPVEYDAFGREQYKWLPYAEASANNGAFKTMPFTNQVSFMNAQYGAQGETYFYTKTNFEASPLNRVTDDYAQGISWAGSEGNSAALQRNTQIKYNINTATDVVRVWNVDDINPLGQFDTYSTTSTYPANELYKTISIDEHKKQVIEFKDKEGKIILKKVQLSTATGIEDDGTGRNHAGWLCTYYVYDDLSSLRCVIQPEAVKQMSDANNWSLSITYLAEQCFRYEYDSRNRMIMKKVPGAGGVYMVYDGRDRLVMAQDANMRAGTKWMVTKYDNLNRPTETGLWMSSLSLNSHLSAAAAATVSGNDYPSTASDYEQLSLTHYDDYAGLPTGLYATLVSTGNGNFAATDNNNWPYPQMPVKSDAVKGMPTWSQVKVLGTLNTFLCSVIIYDDKGRPIQAQSKNISGGIDVTATQYSWAGQPLITVQVQDKQANNAQITVVVSKMTYDDLGRLSKTEKKISNTLVNSNTMSAYKTIAENEYDKLGQLIKKKVGNKPNSSSGTPLAKLNYEHNIRGWLLSVNKNYVTSSANSDEYFGMQLGYDKNSSLGSFVPQYNGNIGGTIWKAEGDQEKRKYDFAYDAVNRLTDATFTQYTNSTFNNDAFIDFSLSNMSYDANGNILSMWQKGLKINTSGYIDKLSYNYLPNSNKLLNVIDLENDIETRLGDFRASLLYQYNVPVKTANTADYYYDDNGNLTKDYNKDIYDGNLVGGQGSGISYNHLNLPSNIIVRQLGKEQIKGFIEYVYDAEGNKLKKIVHETMISNNETLYINGFVYENDVLQFVPHEEGRIRFKPATNTTVAGFEYDYMLKDHLGNVRTVLTEEQQKDIYPAVTLEPSLVTTENTFYNIDQTKIILNTLISGLTNQPGYYNNNIINSSGTPVTNNNPSCSSSVCTTTNSQYLYKLNSGVNKSGLGITLKVMAGDKLDVYGKSYYFQNNPGTGNSLLPIADLLNGFLGGPGAAATTGTHGVVTAGQITPAVGFGSIYSLINDQNNQSPVNSTKPRAFINCIFFDEQFKAVDYRISMVGGNLAIKDHAIDLQNLTVPKNGFVYIYCSNETPVDVFFDNIQVVHNRGAILEETHYYPFGLTMAGISSKAEGITTNKKKYNGYEYNSDFDINLYESFYRTHDPQIGRFWQLDPKPSDDISLYVAMDNNPILRMDPLGDKVAYDKDENVTRKQFRQFKRDIRHMRKNSESFNTGFKELRRDKKAVHRYVATLGEGGAETVSNDKKGFDMRISIVGKDANQDNDIHNTTIQQIAHETGHTLRKINGKEVNIPTITQFIKPGLSVDEMTNNFMRAAASYTKLSELNASHLGNIILSELVNSGNYDGLKVQEYYWSATSKIVNVSTKLFVEQLKVVSENLKLLQAPYDANYYLNTKFDILKEAKK